MAVSAREKELAAALVLETYWTEEAYLAVAALNRPVELSSGRLHVLEMPTPDHQRVVRRLARFLEAWTDVHGGEVFFAPLPVRLWSEKFREPDVMLFLAEHGARVKERYVEPPDLVIEVVSPSTAVVDRGEKLWEYARAGIPEYWVVDPAAGMVDVFVLEGEQYVHHGHASRGERFHSPLLDREVAVDEVL